MFRFEKGNKSDEFLFFLGALLSIPSTRAAFLVRLTDAMQLLVCIKYLCEGNEDGDGEGGVRMGVRVRVGMGGKGERDE